MHKEIYQLDLSKSRVVGLLHPYLKQNKNVKGINLQIKTQEP
jgi:hypothetical protein